METKETEKLLIESILDVLEPDTADSIKITPETRPLLDIPGFDSLLSFSALNSFEEKSGKNLSEFNDLFFSEGKDKYLSIKQIAKLLNDYLKKQGG